MWNVDEKGFTLSTANRSKVIACTGRRPPKTTHDGTRELITIIGTCGAKQVMLSAMVVFKGAAHYKGWYTEVADENHAYFTYSPKDTYESNPHYLANSLIGYITDKIGLDWLKKFDADTKPTEVAKYCLLLLDGHRSHYNLHFCEYAWDNKIILVSYPAHSTHLYQPLDVGLFSPLEKSYGDAVAAHMKGTRTGVVKGTFWASNCAAQASAYTTILKVPGEPLGLFLTILMQYLPSF